MYFVHHPIFGFIDHHELKDFIKQGNCINQVDEQGNNLLFYVTSIDQAKLLIESGIYIFHVNRFGQNVLDVIDVDQEVHELLIRQGCPVNRWF